MSLSIIENSKNQNLNKFVIKGRNCAEHALSFMLYVYNIEFHTVTKYSLNNH